MSLLFQLADIVLGEACGRLSKEERNCYVLFTVFGDSLGTTVDDSNKIDAEWRLTYTEATGKMINS